MNNQHPSTSASASAAAALHDLQGRIVQPDHADYDRLRSVFYGGFDRRPALIVCPETAAEVARVVVFAREQGLELAVRSGGHSMAGHSVAEGGIVLDLRSMRAITIDAQNQTAWVEGGSTAGEVTQAAAAHGLAIGFGDTGSVGVGGITLGGGMGFLSRKYGLTIDSLLAAEVVTADGQVLQVDANQHPDLFWALRGGGGNFGVVTRFKFRLHPVDYVLGGILVLPATAQIIARFAEQAQTAPEELSVIAAVMSAPPMPFLPPELHGKLILFAYVVYAGDLEAGQQALAPFRSLAEPLVDMVRPIRYLEMFPPDEAGYKPTAVAHTMFMDHIGIAEAETILRYLEASDAPMRVAQFRVLGGAVSRVPDDATAYAHRQEKLLVNVASFFASPEEKDRRLAWVRELAAQLDQGRPGAYVNFMGENEEARLQQAYPQQTLARLKAVKAQVDPHNLFHLNHNILPEPEAVG